MLNNVSFAGKVYQLGNVKQTAKPEEIQKIQEYSDSKNVDVMLNSNNAGVYDAILIKMNQKKGQNEFASKTFDFKADPNLEDKKEPEYKSCLSALLYA